jgi:hypothetical protein
MSHCSAMLVAVCQQQSAGPRSAPGCCDMRGASFRRSADMTAAAKRPSCERETARVAKSFEGLHCD